MAEKPWVHADAADVLRLFDELQAARAERNRLREENKRLFAELARLPTKQAAEAFGRVRDAPGSEGKA